MTVSCLGAGRCGAILPRARIGVNRPLRRRRGARCGKGEGYAGLEYGILRSLGHPPVPVLTSVHGLQVEARVPRDAMDLPLAWIATPEESIALRDPAPPPSGIDWDRLDEADLDAMPILRELRDRG